MIIFVEDVSRDILTSEFRLILRDSKNLFNMSHTKRRWCMSDYEFQQYIDNNATSTNF